MSDDGPSTEQSFLARCSRGAVRGLVGGAIAGVLVPLLTTAVGAMIFTVPAGAIIGCIFFAALAGLQRPAARKSQTDPWADESESRPRDEVGRRTDVDRQTLIERIVQEQADPPDAPPASSGD